MGFIQIVLDRLSKRGRNGWEEWSFDPVTNRNLMVEYALKYRVYARQDDTENPPVSYAEFCTQVRRQQELNTTMLPPSTSPNIVPHVNIPTKQQEYNRLWKIFGKDYQNYTKAYGSIDFYAYIEKMKSVHLLSPDVVKKQQEENRRASRERLEQRKQAIRNKAASPAILSNSSDLDPVGSRHGLGNMTIEEYRALRNKRTVLQRLKDEKAARDAIKHNPGLVNNFFQGIDEEKFRALQISLMNKHVTPGMLRPITVFDIETDDYLRPITISAVKYARDPLSGKLRVIDTFQRYYNVKKSQDLYLTKEVHGLTRGVLKRLRREQGADYSESYNEDERDALISFLSNSIMSGHNITGFDINRLGIGEIKNGFVDTVDIARNLWPGENNSLDDVFKRLFGKTMEEAGLPHHDAMSDTIASAMILERLAFSKGNIGDQIRHVLYHDGTYYGPEDSYLGTGIYKSKYRTQENVMALEELNKEQSDDIRNGMADGTNNMHEIPEGDESHEDKGSKKKDKGWGSWDSLVHVLEHLEQKLGTVQEDSVRISTYANTLNTYGRSNWLKTLAKTQWDDMPVVADALGIPSVDVGIVTKGAKAFKESQEYERAFAELKSYYKQGMGRTAFVRSFRRGLADAWGEWNPDKIKQLERAEEWYFEKEHLENKVKVEKYKKGIERNDMLSASQKAYLGKLEGSYDDLVMATDTLIKKNQELLSVYQLLGNIKFYDPNQLLNASRGQMRGINGAARGVIPSAILNPMSRLGDAAFNYWDRMISPYNGAMRVWNSGIGTAVTGISTMIGAASGHPLLGAAIGATIHGIGGAVSQFAGNHYQVKAEMAGYNIQNTLNTLGAISSWLTIPFRALQRVTKSLIASFSGLSAGIIGLTTSLIGLSTRWLKMGMGEMEAMGNPLSELTGIGYSAYQGTTMMDTASLFNAGSMNSVYENFANQQRAFYTTGEVNTNRLIASSMLGIYDKVYGIPVDGNTENQYNNMVNGLLSRMKGQGANEKAKTMYLASQIDSNLPGLLRTADMLGVSDVSQLTNPRNRGMYWNPISPDQERRYRWDQYEYGAARRQFGVIKMKVADKIWNGGGKVVFNNINRIADTFASNGWRAALDEIVNVWGSFTAKFTGVWTTFKGTLKEKIGELLKGKDGEEGWISKITKGVIDIGQHALNVIYKISGWWMDLTELILSKAQGVIAYLSTFKFTPQWKDGGFSFKIENVNNAESPEDSKRIFRWLNKKDGDIYMGYGKGMEPYGKLYMDLVGKENMSGSMTYSGLKELFYNQVGTWYDNEGNALRNGLTVYGKDGGVLLDNFRPQTRNDVDNLFTLLAQDSWGSGWSSAAALYLNNFTSGNKHTEEYYQRMGVLNGVQKFNDATMNSLLAPAYNAAFEGLQGAKFELNIKVNDKDVTKIDTEEGRPRVQNLVRNISDLLVRGLSLETTQVSSN